jgi:hypothetical protein
MRAFRRHAVALLTAFTLWTNATTKSQAQFFIGASDYDHQLQPGAVIPHDGQPFSHRYGFFAGASPYFAANYNQFEYLDYLDRLDRAERFGYRLPTPPAFLTAPRCGPCGRDTGPPALFIVPR